MVESLVQRLPPEDLCVAVSPAIGFCCYEVGEEVVAAVDSRLHRQVFRTERGKVYFNFSHFLCLQLTDAGISKTAFSKAVTAPVAGGICFILTVPPAKNRPDGRGDCTIMVERQKNKAGRKYTVIVGEKGKHSP